MECNRYCSEYYNRSLGFAGMALESPCRKHNRLYSRYQWHRGKWINARVNITNNGSTSQWFVIDVSGVNVADGYPLVATATVRLNASETLPDIPVLITVPPSASTGTYNLFAGIWKHEDFAIPDKLITIQGPQTVTIS